MKKTVLSFFKTASIAVICFIDTVCIFWSAICFYDEYKRMLRLQGDVSLRRYCELLKTDDSLWPSFAAAIVLSLILVLFILLSRNRKAALRQAAAFFAASASVVCLLCLLFFLVMALPGVFDGTVPPPTVLGDIVTILSFSGFLFFGIIACVLFFHRRKAEYRMKRIIVCLAVITAITISVSLITAYSRKPVVALLDDYNICFGDSPKAVASKTPGYCVEIEQLSSANQKVYTFESELWDTSAKISYFFLDGKQLTKVEIMIPCNEKPQADSLFDRAEECVRERYKDEASLICGDIVYCDETTYYLSLGLNGGAFYTILVKDNALLVTCEENVG